jgi:hypothetical protein
VREPPPAEEIVLSLADAQAIMERDALALGYTSAARAIRDIKRGKNDSSLAATNLLMMDMLLHGVDPT